MRSDQDPAPTPSEFGARVVSDGARPTVVVHGEIDLSNVDQFAAAVDAALGTGSSLELDLENTTFMDSTGLEVLVAAHIRLGQIPEAIVLRDPSPALRRLLQVSGVDRLVTVRPPEARPSP